MHKFLIFFNMLAILYFQAQAQTSSAFVLSEKQLLDLKLDTTPQWESIEAAFLQTKIESQKLEDRFAPEVFGKAAYAETRERPIIQFIPVWSPSEEAQLGVRKTFKQGFALSAGVGVDQRSALTPNGTYRDISTSTVRLDLQMDLWKDIFGKLSRAELRSAEMTKQRAELEKEMNHKAFMLSLRRTYWSLVANEEQDRVSQGLLKTSNDQLGDATRRKNAGVADLGEVARYEAQSASRQGTILYLNYQREILFKQLKTLLPTLQGRELKLGTYDLGKTLDQVLACTQTIAQQTQIPREYTKYDEISSLLRKTQEDKMKVASNYGGPDLKLVGTLKTTGVGSDSAGGGVNRGNYGDSFDDWQEHNRSGYSVGLNFTVPVGTIDTRQSQEIYTQKQYDSLIQRNEAELVTTHEQLVRSIRLLTDVIKTQKTNSLALEKRLQVQNRKFREARVSVNDLIQDQDALLNSRLSLINTQLEILNTLFDYLTVFTETPCEFNRI